MINFTIGSKVCSIFLIFFFFFASQFLCFVLCSNHCFPSHFFAEIHRNTCHLIMCSARNSLSQGLDIEGTPYKHGSTEDPGPPAQLVSVSADPSTGAPLLMDMDWVLCLYVFSALSLALLALQLTVRTAASGPHGPPCLPALPLIGSLLSLRSPHPPHVLFKELQGKYGQTYSLMMGSHCVIVVNHHIHAKEVLLKKGKIFAGRSRSVGILEVVSLLHLSHCSSSSVLLFFFCPCNMCN